MSSNARCTQVAIKCVPQRQTVTVPVSEPITIEPLTPREIEIFRLLADGADNITIGRELGITIPTTKENVSRILGKLGAANRTQAVSIGYRIGLLHSGDHGEPEAMTAQRALAIAQRYLRLASELMAKEGTP